MDDQNKNPKYSMLELDGVKYKTILPDRYVNRARYEPANPKLIKAVIPGTVVKILVRKGRKVEEGDNLLLLEAMKMRNEIKASINGIILKINIKEGEQVSKSHLLLEYK